ncbi:unnamed protein product [Auanema sp. JU1783]|nr:unnamed protein product [Auanema sp. JU1783]
MPYRTRNYSDGSFGGNINKMNDDEPSTSKAHHPSHDDSVETTYVQNIGEEDEIIIDGSVEFNEESIHVDEQGNTVIYLPAADEKHHIADLTNAVESGRSSENKPWIIPVGIPMKKNDISLKNSGPPGVVLLTPDSLKAKPQLFVSSGKSLVSRDEQAEQWGGSDPQNEHGNLPSMRPLFRMYGDAVLRKAGNIGINDQEDDSDITCTYDSEDPIGRKESIRDLVSRNQVTFHYKEWPLYWDRPIDYYEACEILCSSLEVDSKTICKTVPQLYKGDGTFIVDLQPLVNRHEVHQDGLGSWGKPTGRVRFYIVDEKGRIVRCDDGRGRLLPGTTYAYKCMLKRYEHPVTAALQGGQNRLIKKIYTALYPPEKRAAVGIAIVTYEWMGRPFDFSVQGSGTKMRKPHSLAPPDGTGNWEAASFSAGGKEPLPATIEEYYGDTPLYAVGAIDFNTAASIILGGTLVDASKICNRVPQSYREAGSFVIDIRNFESDALLRRDNNGVWGKPAGHSRYYKIDSETGDAVRVDRANKLLEGATYDIQILSKRYEHPAVSGRFCRKIYTGKSVNGDRYYPTCSHLAVLVYYWKGDPEWFEAGKQNQVHLSTRNRRFLDEHELEEFFDYAEPSSPGQPLEPAISVCAPKRQRMNSEPAEPVRNEIDNETLQLEIARKEFDNQVRLSALLDRADAFLTRMERSFASNNQHISQSWNESSLNNY